MKIKLNTIFFSMTFLAAFIAELYCIILEIDPYSIIGVGIVLLINCYLLLDSIRGQWIQSRDRTKFYMEQMYREEVEKWNERYTEILNLQKASYTAAKKNAVRMEEKFEVLLEKMDSMEKNNSSALKRVAELQRKLMEGQKNALNIEVNYNKENTKLLIAAMKEEISRLNQEEKLSLILEALKEERAQSVTYLQEDSLDYKVEEFETVESQWLQEEFPETDELGFIEDSLTENSYGDEEDSLQPEAESSAMTTEMKAEINAELITEMTDIKEIKLEEDNCTPEIVPLYDDPGKALTADEIAALFAAYVK